MEKNFSAGLARPLVPSAKKCFGRPKLDRSKYFLKVEICAQTSRRMMSTPQRRVSIHEKGKRIKNWALPLCPRVSGVCCLSSSPPTHNATRGREAADIADQRQCQGQTLRFQVPGHHHFTHDFQVNSVSNQAQSQPQALPFSAPIQETRPFSQSQVRKILEIQIPPDSLEIPAWTLQE